MEAVGSGRGETGDEILVFEFNGVTFTKGLLEVYGLIVEKDTVELDIDVGIGKGSIGSGSSQLNNQRVTTSISLVVSLLGVALRVSFSMVH